MTSENFVIWLEGFLAAVGTNELKESQVRLIKQKLDSVFNKITPTILNYPSIYPSSPFTEPYVTTTCGYSLVDNGNLPSGIKPFIGTYPIYQNITC